MGPGQAIKRMPRKIVSHNEDVFRNTDFLRKRELGFKRHLGYEDHLAKKLITSLESFESKLNNEQGGIFNLEFSLDG